MSQISVSSYAQSGEGVCTNCSVPSLAGTQTASGIVLPTYVYTYLKPGEIYSFSGQSYSAGTYTPITSYSTDGWQLFAPNGQKTVPTTGTPSYTVGSGEGGIWTLIVPQGVAGQWRSFGASVTSGGAIVTGRTYTLLLPIHQSYDNGTDGVDTFTLWYLNVTGGLYKSTFNNYTGWDSNMYADATGMADASKDGYQPLRKSLPRSSPSGSAVGSPNVAIVTNAARPARFNSYDYNSYSANYYKQFFNQPDGTMPTSAPIWSLTNNASTTTWLRPALQTVDLSNLRVNVNGRLLIYTFLVANFNGTVATLRIDQDNNGTTDYTTSIPISSSAVSYTLNTATANIPLSTNLKSTVLIDKGQEIHFILDDVEGFGGLTLIRQNGGSAGTTTSPIIYWDDTSAELDAQNDNPPAQTNETAGISSDVVGGVRGWAYNGNNNSSWGNNSYIDSWAYETVSESETVGLVTIAGTVYDDANGLTDNIVNGTAPSVSGLYAVLTDAASGTVVSNALVASTGSYNFTAVSAGTYQIRLSSTSATVGGAAPAVSLPTGYTTTGEGTATAGDGTPNGITSVTLTATTSVTGVNFGIEQLPVPTSSTLTTQVNPGGTNGVAVPPASFTGTDADGTITGLRFTAFPSNVTSLTIGTTVYTSASFPAGGLTATVGSSVRIDPVDGAVTVVIPFRLIDNANVEGTTGSVSVPFTTLTLSGTVFDDANGLTDNVISGTATNAGGLFAVLTDAASGTVIANAVVATTGTYSFSNLIGGSYQVRLSTTSATVGSTAPAVSLPAGYTTTGEGVATAGDGTPNGITSVTLTTTSLSGVNFGIEQLPVPTSSTLTAQANPGGTNGVAIPPASFTGTDADGTITTIRFTAFPSNVTSLTIGTTVYTLVSFPAGGLTATVGTSVRIDPVDGAVTVVIPFHLIDNANVESITTGSVSVPFTYVVTASPDAGTVSSGTGGTAVANVAANDLINGQPATLGTNGNATVAPVGTYPTGITLNTTTGSLSVAQGTAPGSYTVIYQLCDKLTIPTCTTATALITVTPLVTASPDAGTVSSGTGGTAVANVTANDVVNGQPATLGTTGNATIAQVGTYPTGVTLNTTTGSVSVATGTAPGSYTITYQLCDKLSPVNCTTAVATFVVTPILSGTILNDSNGLTDNTVNGTAYTTGGLFAILTDAASSTVVASTPVLSNGTYSFTGVTTGTYQVRLSTTTAAVGSAAPAVSLPAGYTSTGEGMAAAGDGTPNGITSVTLTATASLTGVNFGIDQLPVPTSSTLTAQANPGGINGVSIPPASFTGTDADGTVTQVHYTAFPSNVTSLTIGTTLYTALTFPAGGVTVATGTAVRVDPIDGNVTVVIPFRVIDNAGQESTTTGSVSVPFTGLVISGTIFDDGNGLTDNIINGTGTNAGGGLYANLVDATGNTVAAQLVPATGVYSFSNVAVGIYSVRLSTTTTAVGTSSPAVSLPTGWTFTGEGTATAGDGTPNGSTQVTITTASVSGVNFGIDQLPVPTSSTLTAQVNPGGTNGIAVAPASFTGTDADGTITAIRYTTFPTNVNSLTIGSTVYTSANFPVGGVTANTGTTVRIDPVDGTVTAVIPFYLIDNANVESITTGSVSVPFTYVVTASPDAGTVSSGTGGTAVANVAANDLINGQPATLGTNGNATIAQVGTYPTGVTLNTTTGSLSVAAGTAPGSYTVVYQLCDRLTPVTCTTSVVSFTVTPGISGTVVNDANGLTDNIINGSGTNAGGLFAILVNSTSTVVTSVSVSSVGTYRFDNVTPGTYSVRLSTTAGITGTAPPAVSLPANWTSTGEGTTAAGDGLVNGITSVTVGSAEVTGVNFSIDQLPTPTSATLTAQANPGGTNAITVPPFSLTGTDPDGTVVAIRYVSFPTNVTTLSINGINYTAATFPAGGVTAATNASVYIDPVDGAGGAVTSVISFRVIDNAGQESASVATVTVPFTCVVTLCPPVSGQKIIIR